MVRVLTLCLLALAVACFVGAPALADDKTNNETHEGKVVTVTSTRLTMSDAQGKEHTHALATDGKVMLDGRNATLTDLKPGMRIRVTTPKSDLKTAIKIEALDKNDKFEKQ
jgi:hypothetical protein